jgi:tRNA-2-methylthio-N6-dimethylallyladenosine synthase
MDQILAEVQALVDSGIREVEFLGQTVNAYRDTAGNTLAELLLRSAEIDGLKRIRFTTSHPAQMTNAIMDAMRDASPIVCPYLHLPVQSGSSDVLKRMRRGYTRDKYLEKIEALRSRIPNLVLGTDIIVGFPGETEAEFEETLSLLDIVRYETCYSFAYSPRPGTASLAMLDSLPFAEKLKRLNFLQERQKEIQAERNARYAGRDVEVLVEGPSKRNPGKFSGRTPEYRLVNFTGDSQAGRMENVRIVATSPFALRGELKVPEPATVR